MTKQKKIWLGILTFLPIVCIIIYIIFFALYFINIFQLTQQPEGPPEVANMSLLFGSFGIMFLMILVAIISSMGLMIYYIIHANSNPKLDSNQKLIWILVLVLANGIGNAVYYFVEIIPEEKPKSLEV